MLAATTTLPTLGRLEVHVEEKHPGSAQAPSSTPARRRRRWVARLLVRLYSEIHVRRQLRHILRLLDREALRVGRDDETVGYRELRAQLHDHTDRVTTTWPGLARIIRGLPVLPATTGLIAAWYIGVGANRPRGAQVVAALFGVALLMVNLHIVLVGPSIRLGFRAKRALFNGGITDMGPLVMTKREVLGSRIKWKPLSSAQSTVTGYRLEDEVFKALGWAKRREPPLDLAFSLIHLGSPITVAVFLGAAATSRESDAFWGSLVLAFLFLLAEVLLLRAQWHTYRRRRYLGEM